MLDSGKLDEKIIAIPFNDPSYHNYKELAELPDHIFKEMCHFFSVYKNLENKETVVNDVCDASEAKSIIQKSLDAYIEKYCK